MASSNQSTQNDDRAHDHDVSIKPGNTSAPGLAPPPLSFERVLLHEPLTLRICNILAEYKDDTGIFKELIQNADDAHASEVSFLIDWREGPLSSLLAPGMKHCQGAALWAYNNMPFTDDDFSNIAKLAGATKKTELNKIGKFGLGFTSVYHLTDVPSFVSRNYVVFFDPHESHLEVSVPDVKLDFQKDPLYEWYPDQFRMYDGVFGCNLKSQESFPGSLFRFPFRTRAQAEVSKIKGEPYEEPQIRSALRSLEQVGIKMMLFLNHIQSVKVYELAKTACSPEDKTLLFELSTVVQRRTKLSQSELINFHLAPDGKLQSPLSSPIRCCSVISLSLSSPQRCTTQRWLVCSSVGQKSCFSFASSRRKVGLMPFASVAVQLSSKNIAVADAGEVFCFLPLSLATGLPFHVNGFFAVWSNRRGLRWHDTEASSGNDSQNVDAVWNELLIKDPLFDALLTMLNTLQSLPQDLENFQPEEFYRLWPDRFSAKHSMWEELAETFYCQIAELDVAVFKSVSTQWIPFAEALFLSSTVKKIPHAETLTKKIVPNFVKIPDDCIHVVNNFKTICGEKFENRMLSVENFVRYVFPNALTLLDPPIRDELIHGVMNLVSQKGKLSGFEILLRDLNFVPCSPGGTNFRQPPVLVEPVGLAAKLYDASEGKFPSKENYQDGLSLYILKRLGMKTADMLDYNDVLERMENVRTMKGQDEVLLRVKAILQLIENLVQKKKVTRDFAHQVRCSKFLPVLSRPKEYPSSLKWYCDTHPVERVAAASTEKVFYRESLNLVSTQGIVLCLSYSELKSRCPSVLPIVGISCHPPCSLTLKQLDVALTCVEKAAEVSNSLKNLVYSIYKELDRSLKEGDLSSSCFSAKTFLHCKHWILVENCLLLPSQLSLRSNERTVLGYLYSVPKELSSLTTLLLAAGVCKHFDKNDFLWALLEMSKDKRGSRLTLPEAKIASELVHKLATEGDEDWRKSLRGSREACLVTEDRRLLPASQLTYVDVFWADESSEDNVYVHRQFAPSGDVLIELGVQPARSRILKRHSLGFPSCKFGQREPITRRLQSIISAYPWGVQILKELVQNADDAQASTLHIVYDKRTHLKKSVFSDDWKQLQGPALLAYNDRPFTKSDIEAIQETGLGNKQTDPTKTGQFGIGFNAVYHLTDCPSILSDNVDFCVFDPHCRYLPDASFENPGGYWRVSAAFWEKFSDVGNCYYSVMKKLKFSSKGGTLFRFPLRNEICAKHSDISREPVSSSDVDKLLKEFAENGADLLVFLNFVTSIKISVIELNGTFKDMFTVRAVIDPSISEKKRAFFDKMVDYKRGFMSISYEMHLTSVCTSVVSRSTFLVYQSIGNEQTKPSYSSKEKLFYLPRGGIAASLDKTALKGKVYCFLPLPGSAPMPVHVNGHFALDSQRRHLFTEPRDKRHKWNETLIDLTIAPAYARFIENAKLFVTVRDTSVSSKDYRKKFQGKIDWFHGLFSICTGDEESYWHRLTCQFYAFLVNSKLPILAVVEGILSPNISEVPETFSTGKSRECKKPEVVRIMEERLPTVREWIALGVNQCPPRFHFNSALYWDPDVLKSFKNRDGISSSLFLKSLLLFLGLPIVATPKQICVSLRRIRNSGIDSVNRSSVYNFLRYYDRPECPCQIVLGNIEKTLMQNAYNADFLLRFLFEWRSGEEVLPFEKLEGLPLLVTADGRLRTFAEANPVICSQYINLLPDNPEIFLHPLLLNSSFCRYDFGSKTVMKLTPFLLYNILKQTGLFKVETIGKCTEKSEDFTPDDSWILTFWKFIASEVLENKKSLCKVIEKFCEWPVIPVLINSRQFRVPIKLLPSVLHCTNNPIDVILEEIGVPVLQKELVEDDNDQFMISRSTVSQLVFAGLATSSDPNSIIKALCHFFRTSAGSEGIEAEAASRILHYFNSHIRLEKANFCRNDLKVLPLFEPIIGPLAAINDVTAFTLPESLPTAGACDWMSAASENVVFLNCKPDLKALYRCLNLNAKSACDVYVEYILEHFEALCDTDRFVHLLFLERLSNSKSLRSSFDNVIKKLTETPCLMKRDRLCCISEFFDESEEIFRLMLETDDFPPLPPSVQHVIDSTTYTVEQQIEPSDWLVFLRRVGLQVVANEQTLENFATRIAFERPRLKSNNEIVSWSEKSRCLFRHLAKNANSFSNEIWSKMGSLAWLPAREVRDKLAAIFNPFSDGSSIDECRFVTSFAESVFFTKKNERLCWTSRSLTPDWEELKTLPRIIRKLGVKGQPQLKDVLLNVWRYTCIASELEKDNAVQLVKITQETIKFLRNHLSFTEKYPETTYLTDFRNFRIFSNFFCHEDVAESLSKLKFVFIFKFKVFACPIQIAQDAFEIPPYVFDFPSEYADETSRLFLLQLGASAEPTPFHYARVLENIFNTSGGAELKSDDLTRALLATKQLFKLLKKHVSRNEMREDLIPVLQPLYLLNQDKILENSSDLVFLDSMTFKRSINHLSYSFLIDLQECGLPRFPEKTIFFLPEPLRPKLLSALISREMTDGTVIQSVSERHRHLASVLENFLSSDDFLCAISSIYLQETKEEHLPPKLQSEYKTISKNFNVLALKGFSTCLVKFDNKEEVSAVEDGNFFFQRLATENATVFITESVLEMIDNRETCNCCIFLKEFLSFFNFRLRNEFAVSAVFQQSCPSKIPAVLEMFDIPLYQKHSDNTEACEIAPWEITSYSKIQTDSEPDDNGPMPTGDQVRGSVPTSGWAEESDDDGSMPTGQKVRESVPTSSWAREAKGNDETFENYPFSKNLPIGGGRRMNCISNWEMSAPPPIPPNPELGKMFFHQARADLFAAKNHFLRQREKSVERKNFALVCFLCHEYVEKILKGILIAREGLGADIRHQHYFALSAAEYCGHLSDDLQESIRLLQNHDYLRSRYPDSWENPACIPAAKYTETEASAALKGSEGIEKIVRNIFDYATNSYLWPDLV